MRKLSEKQPATKTAKPPASPTPERASTPKISSAARESVTELRATKSARKFEGKLAMNKTSTLRTGWISDCSVKVEGGLLHYVQKEKNEAGTLILQNGQVIRSSRDEARFFFLIRTAKEVVWFEARDSAALVQWMEVCRDQGAIAFNPTIEGVLSLIQTSLLSKKLTEKWFVLMRDKIEYFADQYSPVVEGFLPLPACSVITTHEDLRLEIAENGDDGSKSVCIQAKTDQILQRWAEALRAHLASQDSRVNPSSIREGYLGDGTAKNKKMYYILTDGMLQYFKSRNDEKEAGHVMIDGGSVCHAMTGPGFSLAASGDEDEAKIMMFAANVEERVSWVATITGVIKRKPEQIHDSLKEGYLFGAVKKGAWKKRYVVLMKTRLQYYKKRSDAAPEGEVIFNDGGCVNQESEVNCLYIAASGDEGETSFYYLVAADQAQCQTWLDTIKSVMVFSPTNPSSLKEDYFDVGWDSKKLLRRYCVLLPNCFQVFRSRKDKQCAFEVDIDGGSLCNQASDEQQNLFYIASNKDKECKKLYVLHKREQDTVSWIAAILQLISSKDYRAVKESIHEDYLLFQTGLFKKWTLGYCVILSDRIVSYGCKEDVLKKKEEISHVLLPSGGKIIPYNSDQASDSKTWGFSILQNQDVGEEAKGVNFATESNSTYLDFVAAVNVVLKENYQPVNVASIKEGYLSCGHKKTNLKWRHVILLPDKLLYYARRSDSKPSGEVALPGGAQNASWGDLGFVLASSGDEGEQPFYLQAANAKEKQEWCAEIDQVIGGKSAKVHPNSRREGYLQVSSKKGGAPQKRYTVLLDNGVHYFKSRSDAEALGTVKLEGGAVVDMQDDAGFIAASGDASEKNYFYFTGSSLQETKSWVDDISQLLSTKDSKLDSLSLKEGYVQGGSSLQNLKRYYAIVTNEKLVLYKTRAISKDCVEFGLNSAWTCSEWKSTFIHFVFNAKGESAYYMEAASEEEREQWLAVFEELMFRDSKTDPESINEGFVLFEDSDEYRKVFAVLTPRVLTLFEGRGRDRILSLALDEGTRLDLSPDPFTLIFLGPAGGSVVLKFRLQDTKLEWQSNIVNVLEERAEVARKRKEKKKALIAALEQEEAEAEAERQRVVDEEAQALKVAELERRSKEIQLERQVLEERSRLAEGLQKTLQQERAAVEEQAKLELARHQAESRIKAEEHRAELRRKQEKERKEAEIKRKEQEEKKREMEEKRREEEQKRKEAVAEQRRKELKAREQKALAAKKDHEEKDAVKKPVKSRVDTGLRIPAKPKTESSPHSLTAPDREQSNNSENSGDDTAGGEESEPSRTSKDDTGVKKPARSKIDTGLTKLKQPKPPAPTTTATGGDGVQIEIESLPEEVEEPEHESKPESEEDEPKLEAAPPTPHKSRLSLAPKPKVSPGTPRASTCDLCEDARSSVWCNECKMQLCGADGQNCDEDMHKVTSRARHVRVPVIEEVVKDFSTILWCYLCGQKFTSASLGFHLTQCPVTRKLSLRELPKELRPPVPPAPSVPIPTEDSGKEAYAAYNREAQEIFRDHMPCCPFPGCGRKFAPESIQKHMRGCRFKSS